MLAYILAIAIALGSLFFYMAAFFFPEVHRKNDFYWAFLGLFYALILWVAANRITGSVLLAQTASVVLLGWMGWQTLTLRKSVTPAVAQTKVTPEIATKARTSPISSVLGLFRKQNSKPTEKIAVTTTETIAESTNTSIEEAVEIIEESTNVSIEEAIEESNAIAARPEIDITSDETVEDTSVDSETATEIGSQFQPQEDYIESKDTEFTDSEIATPEIIVETIGSEDDTVIERFIPRTETNSEDNPLADDTKST